jgi:hypothetical protein
MHQYLTRKFKIIFFLFHLHTLLFLNMCVIWKKKMLLLFYGGSKILGVKLGGDSDAFLLLPPFYCWFLCSSVCLSHSPSFSSIYSLLVIHPTSPSSIPFHPPSPFSSPLHLDPLTLFFSQIFSGG